MKFIRAVFSGLITFLVVVIMVISGSYLRCLAEGVVYNFLGAAPLALKAGVVPGAAIFLLSLIGSPRRFPPN